MFPGDPPSKIQSEDVGGSSPQLFFCEDLIIESNINRLIGGISLALSICSLYLLHPPSLHISIFSL